MTAPRGDQGAILGDHRSHDDTAYPLESNPGSPRARPYMGFPLERAPAQTARRIPCGHLEEALSRARRSGLRPYLGRRLLHDPELGVALRPSRTGGLRLAGLLRRRTGSRHAGCVEFFRKSQVIVHRAELDVALAYHQRRDPDSPYAWKDVDQWLLGETSALKDTPRAIRNVQPPASRSIRRFTGAARPRSATAPGGRQRHSPESATAVA